MQLLSITKTVAAFDPDFHQTECRSSRAHECEALLRHQAREQAATKTSLVMIKTFIKINKILFLETKL